MTQNRKRILFAVILFRLSAKLNNSWTGCAEADNAILITAYEKKISKLEEEKIELDEKIANCDRPLKSFDETFRTSFAFL